VLTGKLALKTPMLAAKYIELKLVFSYDLEAPYSQCDQTFSAVITKRCAEILPNWIFFYQTRANSAF
jgi:hypothetical protein